MIKPAWSNKTARASCAEVQQGLWLVPRVSSRLAGVGGLNQNQRLGSVLGFLSSFSSQLLQLNGHREGRME